LCIFRAGVPPHKFASLEPPPPSLHFPSHSPRGLLCARECLFHFSPFFLSPFLSTPGPVPLSPRRFSCNSFLQIRRARFMSSFHSFMNSCPSFPLIRRCPARLSSLFSNILPSPSRSASVLPQFLILLPFSQYLFPLSVPSFLSSFPPSLRGVFFRIFSYPCDETSRTRSPRGLFSYPPLFTSFCRSSRSFPPSVLP